MSFKRILVPLDGSYLAEQALVPALALAEALAAKIFLLRVASPLSLNLDPNLYQGIISLRQSRAKRYLRSVQSRFSSSSAEIDTQVVVGRGARPIINFAEECKIDLIVMSSHVRYGVNRWICWIYGSVANKVLHTAPCSMVMIYPKAIIEPLSFKRILVPLDGSSIAEQALEPALELAEAITAELLLLRVSTAPRIAVAPMAGRPGPNEYMEAADQEANAYLQSVQAAMEDVPISITSRIATGPAADSIIDIADSQQVGLIVMCSYGRSGIERWVSGNIAEKVLRGAKCVTLITKGQGLSK